MILANRALSPYREVSGSFVSSQGTLKMKPLFGMPVVAFLVVATALEVSGDALIRKALFENAGWARLGLFALGAGLLAGYGTFLNLAPLEFGQVVGLYIATLFVMWQIINFAFFRSLSTLPIRSEEHTSELQSRVDISYAVFCLK